MLFCGLVVQFTGSNTTYALIPSDNHRQRYIEPNGSYTYWISDKEGYVKSTLPNEWFVSWSNESLQAGAVIIRSGVFWRVNRSVLGSSAPNNNCYKGGSGSTLYYRTVPNTRGGEFDPNLECSQEDDQTNSDPTYPNT
jgi:peptidoglycan hydrolase-like amidase